jgi:DNA (cytosine-5)-methyltransferase 1|tara:strand:- start:20140 stop:20934 length:795 start_codon:yes stop_codon:yes gene_type:complete
MLKTLDLFAGIGGFSRGLEATGFFETSCFVENEPYCQAVLRYHWPDVPVLGDIRDVKGSDLPTRPDVICGGFPCQPFSQAGRQLAQDDPRHLWPEMFRLVRELRPTWVVGENVTGLIKLGLDEVLTDLEGEGYATRTFDIPACAAGAPHLRHRLWIVAHADSESEPDGAFDGNARQRQLGFEFVADAGMQSKRREKQGQYRKGWRRNAATTGEGRSVPFWEVEPDVGRVVNGLPNRVPQLRALGNSIVPQIAQEIGEAIKVAHG